MHPGFKHDLVAMMCPSWTAHGGINCVTVQANENCIKAFSPRVVEEFTGFMAFFAF